MTITDKVVRSPRIADTLNWNSPGLLVPLPILLGSKISE